MKERNLNQWYLYLQKGCKREYPVVLHVIPVCECRTMDEQCLNLVYNAFEDCYMLGIDSEMYPSNSYAIEKYKPGPKTFLSNKILKKSINRFHVRTAMERVGIERRKI